MESLNENHAMPLKSEEEFSLRKGKRKKKKKRLLSTLKKYL